MINHRTGQQLTPVEHLVLRGMANGQSNQQIADDMCRAVSTIKTHAARTLAKLGARNRAHAVRLAYNAGLLTAADIQPTPTGARP